MNKYNILFLLFNQVFLKFASLYYIYEYVEGRDQFSSIFTLLTTFTLIIGLNTSLPLQSLLTEGKINKSAFWLSSILLTIPYSYFISQYMDVGLVYLFVSIFCWAIIQSISFFYAFCNKAVIIQSILSCLNLLCLIVFSEYLSDSNFDFNFKSHFYEFFLLLTSLGIMIFLAIKDQFLVIAKHLKYRVIESFGITFFQYSFLINIAIGSNHNDGFFFLILSQVSGLFVLIPNVVSNYLLRNMTGRSYDLFYHKVLIFGTSLSVIVLLCCFYSDDFYYILYPLSFMFGAIFRVVTVKLISKGATHIPMIANLAQVIIFYLIMNGLSEYTYEKYVETFVLSSSLSAVIYFALARKVIRS